MPRNQGPVENLPSILTNYGKSITRYVKGKAKWQVFSRMEPLTPSLHTRRCWLVGQILCSTQTSSGKPAWKLLDRICIFPSTRGRKDASLRWWQTKMQVFFRNELANTCPLFPKEFKSQNGIQPGQVQCKLGAIDSAEAMWRDIIRSCNGQSGLGSLTCLSRGMQCPPHWKPDGIKWAESLAIRCGRCEFAHWWSAAEQLSRLRWLCPAFSQFLYLA